MGHNQKNGYGFQVTCTTIKHFCYYSKIFPIKFYYLLYLLGYNQKNWLRFFKAKGYIPDLLLGERSGFGGKSGVYYISNAPRIPYVNRKVDIPCRIPESVAHLNT